MSSFSNEEKRDMLKLYYKFDRNSTKTAQIYFELYPERQQPDRTLFGILDKHLAEYGAFQKPRMKYGSRMEQNTRNNLLAEINADPSKSTHQVSAEMDVPQTSVWREFKKSGLKCYKIHISQKLHPGDPERRMEFCSWLSNREDPSNFLKNIIWTDESTFSNCGVFNRNNEHIWSENNPRHFREVRPQVRFRLNVWAGIYNDRILGPHFFSNTLNGETYLRFLRNEFEEYMDTFPLVNYNSCWFQHDGAPPHNKRAVCEYLHQRFPNRWLGNSGPVRWPARSPDLTVLDTFLWGTLKNRIYGEQEYDTVDELRDNIITQFRSIRRRDIVRAVLNLRRRARLCIQEEGHHFEHLL